MLVAIISVLNPSSWFLLNSKENKCLCLGAVRKRVMSSLAKEKETNVGKKIKNKNKKMETYCQEVDLLIL